jgi:hypothetical protein
MKMLDIRYAERVLIRKIQIIEKSLAGMGQLERAEQSLAADPIDLSALSKRIDCFFESLQTLDNGFKSRWFALKHSIGDHLFLVGCKRLQERCSRNQA